MMPVASRNCLLQEFLNTPSRVAQLVSCHQALSNSRDSTHVVRRQYLRGARATSVALCLRACCLHLCIRAPQTRSAEVCSPTSSSLRCARFCKPCKQQVALRLRAAYRMHLLCFKIHDGWCCVVQAQLGPPRQLCRCVSEAMSDLRFP